MGSSWTTAVLNEIPPFMEQFHPSCHCAIWQSSITTCFSQSLKTGLCITTSCNFNSYPGALVLFCKHVVRELELGFYTSRRCTMQLNQTQWSPLIVLLQLNFCYQVQTTVVSSNAYPSSYSSVATTFYPTLVYNTPNLSTWLYSKNCYTLHMNVLHSFKMLDNTWPITQHDSPNDWTLFGRMIISCLW